MIEAESWYLQLELLHLWISINVKQGSVALTSLNSDVKLRAIVHAEAISLTSDPVRSMQPDKQRPPLSLPMPHPPPTLCNQFLELAD